MTAEHREWVWAAVALTVVALDVAIAFGTLN
jgi:heme exporter protein D